MPEYSFKMLGPFQVLAGGDVVNLPRSKKARALLAYLAHKQRRQSKDHLARMFFADTSDPKGGLRWCISRLRAALDKTFVVTDSDSVRLDYARMESDVARFQSARANSAESQELLSSDTLTGDFLADLGLARAAAFEAWRLAEQVACNSRRAELLRSVANNAMGQTEAIDAARALVDLDSSREGSWVLLVEALLSMKQLSEARNVQRIAVEQLERDGIRLQGKLENVWLTQDRGRSAGRARSLANSGGALELKPRVAVLAGRPGRQQDSALADDIADALFRACNVTKTVTVLAPAMSARIAAASQDLFKSAREENIDYLMSSSLRRRRDRIYVDIDLVDTASGSSCFHWSRSLREDQPVPDRVEAYFSARFEIDLPIALIGRTREKPSEQWSARDMYLLALPRLFSADGFDPAGAHDLLESALSRQPYFGQASVALALIRMFMPRCNDDEEQLENTLSLARRAVEICQDDAFVLGIAAVTIGHIAKETDTGIDLALRALSINPYSVMAGVAAAMTHHYKGDDKACLEFVDAVEDVTETEPISFFCHTCRAMAHYQCKEYELALHWSRKAVGHNPKFIIALRYLLASMGQLGLADEAEPLARKIHALDPSENVEFFSRRSAYRYEDGTRHLCDGLRKSGLPESSHVADASADQIVGV